MACFWRSGTPLSTKVTLNGFTLLLKDLLLYNSNASFRKKINLFTQQNDKEIQARKSQ